MTRAVASKNKIKKNKNKQGVSARKHFSSYPFYSSSELNPSEVYQTFTPVEGAPDIFDWVETLQY
jgi:hypothetical protein